MLVKHLATYTQRVRPKDEILKVVFKNFEAPFRDSLIKVIPSAAQGISKVDWIKLCQNKGAIDVDLALTFY